MSFLDLTFLGNSFKNIVIVIFLIILFILFFKNIKNYIITIISILFSKTKNKIDDLIIGTLDGISNLFWWVIFIFLIIKILIIPDWITNNFNNLVFILILFEAVKMSKQIISYLIEKKIEKKEKNIKTAYRAIETFAGIGLWIVAVIVFLTHINFNITALAASLGMGGLVIAFAFKEILKDLFAYFVLLFDKPILEGDYIAFGDYKGTIKKIGLQTTRLKVADGREIVIPNDKLTSKEIENYGKAKKRLIKMDIGLEYGTTKLKLKKFQKKIKKIIESFEHNTFRRCVFKSFGESSLDFEIVFFINERKYSLYTETIESINYQILDFVNKNKINIAFPTRVIYNRK